MTQCVRPARVSQVYPLTDVDVFVVQQGAGPAAPLVLIHGWGCDHTVWDPMVQIAGPDASVVAPDLRGHGRSVRACTPHTITRMADDLAELLSQLGRHQVIAVGHSMGGNVAVELAVRHPDLVQAVVVVDPAYGDPGWAETEQRAADLSLRGTAAPVQTLSAAFHPNSDPTLRRAVEPVLAATDAQVLIEALHSTYTDPDAFGHLPDTVAKLRQLNQPLLSLYADPAAAARARDFPIRHRVELIAHTGHFIPLEQPAALWDHIHHWVADLPTTPKTRS